VVVVEQPPKGGDGVTIHRDFCCVCIHLALLFICDACTLYGTDQDATTGWDYIAIYGMIASCVYYTRGVVVYYMRRIVVYVCVRPQEMTWDYVMQGPVLYDEGGTSLEV
jgi:hypothetical protein